MQPTDHKGSPLLLQQCKHLWCTRNQGTIFSGCAGTRPQSKRLETVVQSALIVAAEEVVFQEMFILLIAAWSWCSVGIYIQV